MYALIEILLIYDLIKSMMLHNSEIRARTVCWMYTIMTSTGSVTPLLLIQIRYANIYFIVAFETIYIFLIYSFICVLYHKIKVL